MRWQQLQEIIQDQPLFETSRVPHCPWKQCDPFMHAACPAQHCGQRPFLYDDLHVIKLPAHLIAAPPLILWPEAVTRC
jgi:hypothetical protein